LLNFNDHYSALGFTRFDTLKQKTYNVRREELQNYFHRFQSASQNNGKHNIFISGATHLKLMMTAVVKNQEEYIARSVVSSVSGLGQRDVVRIATTISTKLKDAGRWLEQSLHPFLFGLLHKLAAPSAYVCAEGGIYDATA